MLTKRRLDKQGEQQLPPLSILQSTVLASSPHKLRNEIKVPRTQSLINARHRPTRPPQAPHKLLVLLPPGSSVQGPSSLPASLRHQLGSKTRTKWKQSQNVSDSLPKRQNTKSLENTSILCHVPPSKMQKFFLHFKCIKFPLLQKRKKMSFF